MNQENLLSTLIHRLINLDMDDENLMEEDQDEDIRLLENTQLVLDNCIKGVLIIFFQKLSLFF